MTSSARETYESLNIEPKPLRPHILAAATVVFGDDYYGGRRETINLSGFVQMNKWPMPGFNHKVDDEGYASFETELISAPEVGIKGYSYLLEDRIQILSNPYLPNTGHVKQIVPGKNFPAEFYIRRFGILETSTMRLAHRGVIDVKGIVDNIPPYKTPLTPPFLGRPYGDATTDVMPAHNVVRGTNLPAAWYTSNDNNEAVGETPSAFFAASPGPCVSMLTDPSIIIQASMEGTIKVEVNGKTEEIALAGAYPVAAGAEILLFGPEKHDRGGVLAQLARVAMIGDSKALGGRVMLRASFFSVSGGVLGEGNEDSLGRVRFPGDLHFDAQLELLTPSATLYAASPVHLSGKLTDLEPAGTTLSADYADAALLSEDGKSMARLVGVNMKVGESLVGTEAYVTA
jgi:hypothetical protein